MSKENKVSGNRIIYYLLSGKKEQLYNLFRYLDNLKKAYNFS